MKRLILNRFWILSLSVIPLLLPNSSKAAFTYPGCADLQDSDFGVDTLVYRTRDVTLFPGDTTKPIKEPMKMAFDMDAQGNVDVYFTQRSGQLKRYNAISKTTEILGTIPKVTNTFPHSKGEEGLTGIALDPGFKTNRRIFLYYSDSTLNANDGYHYVSRFVLNGSNLDLSSEIVLLKIKQKNSSPHTGGAMQFDREGNLWITVGDDGTHTNGANTNELRGKILRIHPTDDGGYTIPNGNLFPPGTNLTKPEIYTMGNRNPYTLTLDTLRKAITWGEIGPDQQKDTEEHNFTTNPGFFGYPIFSGKNINLMDPSYTGFPVQRPTAGVGTAAAPLNNFSDNTGINALPPAIPAIHAYRQACAITGPVYYYNPKSTSSNKMPPHFDGAWFTSNWLSNSYMAFKLNQAGTAITDSMPVFKNLMNSGLLDFQEGPDGEFYMSIYGTNWYGSDAKTGIFRAKYKGNCKPTDFTRPTGIVQKALPQGSYQSGNRISFTTSGKHELLVRDLAGRHLIRISGSGPANYDLSQNLHSGIFLVTLTTDAGTVNSKIVIK